MRASIQGPTVSTLPARPVVGIGTWPFGATAQTPLPLAEALDQIVAWGYSAIDYGAIAPHPAPRAGTREADDLHRAFTDRALTVTALVPSFSGLSLLRPADHDEYLERFLEHLELCRSLGSTLIRLDTIDTPEAGAAVGSSTVIARIASIWARCAEAAAADGVTIAWEFEPCCVLNTPSEICALVSELEQPGFGILFDTAHAHSVAVVGARHMEPGGTLPGGQLALLRSLEGRIAHIHLLDSDGSLNEVPGTTIHMPFGTGDVDFAAVIPALVDTQVPHWTIDLCFWEDPAGAAEPARLRAQELLSTHSPDVPSTTATRHA